MALLIISYDLSKPDRDYSGLYESIKSFGTWWHYLESTWIIKTDKTPSKIYTELKPHIDENDNLLIIEAGKKRQGWLPKEAWDWIKSNQN